MKAAGLAAVLLFLVLVARFWDPVYRWTSFLQLDTANAASAIDAFQQFPVYIYRTTGPYDGAYYAQLAYHPLLNSAELRTATDSLAYRARRILPAALAWCLSIGRPAWIVYVYSSLNVFVWLALAALFWRVLGVADLRTFLAWAGVLFSAGALISVRLALTDLLAATLLTAALWAEARGRSRGALGWLATAGLARETSLLGVAGLWTRPWVSRANLGRAVLVALPLAAWLGYVTLRTGPGEAGWHNFEWPLSGLLGKCGEALAALHGPADAAAAVTSLLALVGLVFQAAWLIRRADLTDPWWRMGALFIVLMAVLGTPVWEGFPGAAPRVLLPLSIAFNVVAAARRLAPGWLILGNLSVAAGVLALLDLPHDPHQLATARLRGVAVVAQTDGQWYGAEHSARHVWAWAPHRGTLTLKAWTLQAVPATLSFALRSLNPRPVIIRLGAQELWRGEATSQLVRVSLPVTIPPGPVTLDFSSPAAPIQEDPALGGRALGFALYDVELAVPQPE